VTVSQLFRRSSGAAFITFIVALPQALAAQQAPTPQDLIRTSQSGDYLAARHAGADRDAAAAAAYYRAALKADPRNTELLNRAFLSELVNGNVDEAVRFADRILKIEKDERVARLVVGVRALKQKQYADARQQLTQSIRGPITDLAATLLTAWSLQGSNQTDKAIEALDRLSGPDWYDIFKNLHAGLIYDLAGNRKEAGKRFERAYKLDPTALRVVQAYGSWASRGGSKDDALKIFKAFDDALPRHPLITAAMDEVNRGGKLPPLIESPQAGASEVLYGLGASLGRRGGEDFGLAYLQLALYLAPSQPLALLSLADLYEQLKKPQLAIKIYERVPATSPLHRNAAIQLAVNLDSLDRSDEAKKHLEKIVTDDSKDVEAILALGNIQRGRKQYAECADTYSKVIATFKEPQKSNWLVFYFRGICYERAKQWARAEADLKKALDLYPDEPHVLNYLGYSWIDQGTNLDEGMRMIRRAVEQRSDDGYIVDSLGWAYYRVGNYDDSVKNLERAVELKPEDPTINDHLGDAYWRIGRTLEARFQWAHARDLKPEPDDLAKIDQKLKAGLTEEGPPPSAEAEKKKPDNGG
jgi:tetratricopeptide (TPR) repeat protein